MPDPRQTIYDWMKENGLTQDEQPAFFQNLQDENSRRKLWKYLNDNKLITETEENFVTQLAPQVPPPQVPPPQTNRPTDVPANVPDNWLEPATTDTTGAPVQPPKEPELPLDQQYLKKKAEEGGPGSLASKSMLGDPNAQAQITQATVEKPTLKKPDQYSDVTAGIYAKMPLLASHGYVIEKVGYESNHPGWIEFLSPEETGDGTEPGNETGKPLIRLYSNAPTDPEELEEAIWGDMLHHLSDADPYWKSLRDQYMSARPDEIKEFDQNKYKELVESGEESRPFQQWIDVSRADAHVRESLKGNPEWLRIPRSPEQEDILAEMQHYLQTGEKNMMEEPYRNFSQVLVDDIQKTPDDPTKRGHQALLMDQKRRVKAQNDKIVQAKEDAVKEGGVDALKKIQSNESAIDKDPDLDDVTKNKLKLNAIQSNVPQGYRQAHVRRDPSAGKYGWIQDDQYTRQAGLTAPKPKEKYSMPKHQRAVEKKGKEYEFKQSDQEFEKEMTEFEKSFKERELAMEAIATYEIIDGDKHWKVKDEKDRDKLQAMMDENNATIEILIKKGKSIRMLHKELSGMDKAGDEEWTDYYAPDDDVLQDLRERGVVLEQDGQEWAFFNTMDNSFIIDPEYIEQLENPEEWYTETHKRPWWIAKVNLADGEVSDEDKITYSEAWREHDYTKVIPIWSGISDAKEMYKLFELAGKADKDPDSLTPEEADFLLKAFDGMNRLRTTGAMAFDIGINSVPFALEFAIGGGLAKGAVKAGELALKKWMKNGVAKIAPKLATISKVGIGGITVGGAGTFGVKTLGRYIVGGEVGGRIEADKLRRMSGNIQVMGEDFVHPKMKKFGDQPQYVRLTEGEPKDVAEWKAKLGYLGEIITEETGWILTSTSRKVRNRAMKNAVERSIHKSRPNLPPGSIRLAMRKAGIGNPLEESFEERLNEFYSAWVVENEEYKPPTWQQIQAEFMGFMPMSGFGTAGAVIQERSRNIKRADLEEDLIAHTQALQTMTLSEQERVDQEKDFNQRIQEAVENNDREALYNVLDDILMDQVAIPTGSKARKIGKKGAESWIVNVHDQFGNTISWYQVNTKEEADAYQEEIAKTIENAQEENGEYASKRLQELVDQYGELGWEPFGGVEDPAVSQEAEVGEDPAPEPESRATQLIREYREIRKKPATEEGNKRLKEIINELEELPSDEFSAEDLLEDVKPKEKTDPDVDLKEELGTELKDALDVVRKTIKDAEVTLSDIVVSEGSPDESEQLMKRADILLQQSEIDELKIEEQSLADALEKLESDEEIKFQRKGEEEDEAPVSRTVAEVARKLAYKNILSPENVKDKSLKNKNVNRAILFGFREILKGINEGNVDVSGARQWYSQDTADALDILKKEIPEIGDNPDNEIFTKLIMAITSQGVKVKDNWEMTAPLVQGFLKTGKWDIEERTYTNKKTGEEVTGPAVVYQDLEGTTKVAGWIRRKIVTSQLQLVESIINKHGMAGAMRLLMEKRLGSELHVDLGPKNTTKTGDHYGAERFGPKVGAFFLNLNGISELPTFDLWWSRTWNRWMGTPTKIVKGEEVMVDSPRNKSERKAMKEAVDELAVRMTDILGGEVKPEDVQAMLWYLEKDLYIQEGATPSDLVSYRDVALKRHEQLTTSADAEKLRQAQEDGRIRPGEPGEDRTGDAGRDPKTGEEGREADTERKRTPTKQKTPFQITTPVPLDRLRDGRVTPEEIYTISGGIEDRDTTNELKIYDLTKLVENPEITQTMLDLNGLQVEYFSFEENPERGVVFRLPKLKTNGYEQGTLWIYNPAVEHGSFKDEEYTRAWRVFHETGHGLSEIFLFDKYGPSKREGRLGFEHPGKRGTPPKQVDVTLRPLTLMEAQRAVEWEDTAFRIQRMLLEESGITISNEQYAQEYNINITDAVFRVLTGDFGNPGEFGYVPSTKPVSLKSVLRKLQNQEEEIAKSQGREPTDGVELKTWKRVTDGALRKAIKDHLKSIEDKKDLFEGEDPLFQRTAWHGSPAWFDKFLSKFINTGEKNQAYGWGLYFTDLEKIGRWYATNLTRQQPPKSFNLGPIEIIKNSEFVEHTPESLWKDRLKYKGLIKNKDRAEALSNMIWMIQHHGVATSMVYFYRKPKPAGTHFLKKYLEKEIKQAESKETIKIAVQLMNNIINNEEYIKMDIKPTRNLYRVEFGKDLERELVFMDWHGSFKDNHEVRKLIWNQLKLEFPDKMNHFRLSLLNPENEGYGGLMPESIMSGSMMYQDLTQYLHPFSDRYQQAKFTSEFLNRAGIDGNIFDSAEPGQKNYVIFDQEIVNIEEQIQFQRIRRENVRKQNSINDEMQDGDVALPYSGTTAEEAREAVKKAQKKVEKYLNDSWGDWKLADLKDNPELQATKTLADVFGQKMFFITTKDKVPFRAMTLGDHVFIDVNSEVDSTHSSFFSTGHELVHRLRKERPELYQKLREVVGEETNNKDGVLRKYGKLYVDRKGNEDKIFEEFVADVMGDAMQEKAFWEKVYERSPELMQKMMDILNKILTQLRFNAKEHGVREYINDFERVVEVAGEVMGEYMVLQNPELTQTKTFRDIYTSLPSDLKKRVMNLWNYDQRRDAHPEGNVLKHTIAVTNRALQTGDIDFALSALFHDIGKDETAGIHPKKGHITHYGHEHVSAKLVKKHAKWIQSMGGNALDIYWIVKQHMRMKSFDRMKWQKQEKMKAFRAFDKLQKFSKEFDVGGLGVEAPVKPLSKAEIATLKKKLKEEPTREGPRGQLVPVELTEREQDYLIFTMMAEMREENRKKFGGAFIQKNWTKMSKKEREEVPKFQRKGEDQQELKFHHRIFVNKYAERYNELNRPNRDEFLASLKEEGVSDKDRMRVSLFYSQIKDKGLIEPGVVTPLEKRVGDLELKEEQAERELKKADTPAKKKKLKVDRMQLRQRIKDLISGHGLGSKEKKLELRKLRKAVRLYAKQNLPKRDLTSGQVIPALMTSLNEGNLNEKKVLAIFNKIDQIASKIHSEQAVKRIKKLLKKTKPFTKSGIMAGRTSPEYQMVFDMIKSFVKLSEEETDYEKSKIYKLSIAENRDPSDEVRKDKSGNKIVSEAEELWLLELFGGLYTKHGVGSGKRGLYIKSLDQIADALENLDRLITDGKTIFYMKEKARKTLNAIQTSRSLGVITGAMDPKIPKLEVYGSLKRRTLGKDDTTIIRKFWNGMRGLNSKLQSWKTLMDILSFNDKTSAPYESFLNKRFGEMLTDVEYSEQEGVRIKEATLTDNAERIFGEKDKALKKLLEKHEKPQVVDVEIQIEVLPARYHYIEANKTKLKVSQFELAQYWMWMQDPKLEETFKRMGWTEDTIQQIEDALDPDVKRYAEYLLDEFYPAYYPEINDVFREMFYINLSYNEKYSHLVREHFGKDAENLSETLESTSSLASAYSGHLIARVDSKRPLRPTDMMVNVYQHIFQMEHFIHYAPAIRELRAVFLNEEVRQALEEHFGSGVLKTLDNFVDDMARGGISPEKVSKLADYFIGNFVKAKIGLKPVIFLKQLASSPANMAEIPAPDFMMGMGHFFTNFREAMDVLGDSDLVKNRGKGFNRDVKQLLRKSTANRLANQKGWRDFMLGLAKLGDIGAILMGGWSVYLYNYNQHLNDKKLNPTGSEEDAHWFAIAKFEDTAETWQQSGAVKNLSELQRSGSVMKMFTMFLNSPIQYYQQGQTGIRGLISGRGKKGANLKRVAISYVLLQGMFNIIAQGMRYDPDDDDFWWKLGIAWTRGIPIFGGALEWLMFRTYMYQMTPVQSIIPDAGRALDSGANIIDAVQGKEEYSTREWIGMADDVIDVFGTIFGFAYEGPSTLIEGAVEVAQGKADLPVQRGLGYSNWALYGTNNPKELLMAKAIDHGWSEKEYWKRVVEYYRDRDKTDKYISGRRKQERMRYRRVMSFRKDDIAKEIIDAPENDQKVRLLLFYKKKMDEKKFNSMLEKLNDPVYGRALSEDAMHQYEYYRDQ